MQERKTASGFHKRLTLLADAHHLVEDALRYFPFRGLRNFNHVIARNDSYLVAIRVETKSFAGNIVDHDGVELLGCELLTRVLEDIFGFRGEAHNNLRLPAHRNL